RAVRVIDVPKDDGVGRARLLAGSLHLSILDRLLGPLGIDASLRDALHAVRAFLHYAAAAHGDIGIAHHLQLRRLPVLEEQEVEASHLIGTVVRAIASSNAAVVHHVVEAFRAVYGRAYRTNHFAGRVLALHARNRLKEGARISGIALVIRVDTEPMHVPP